MQNNNYQNRNNRGYTPPTSDNGFNNQNYNRPLYAAPAPGGSYNKKSNTGLIAAISGLSVLLVAVRYFCGFMVLGCNRKFFFLCARVTADVRTDRISRRINRSNTAITTRNNVCCQR